MVYPIRTSIILLAVHSGSLLDQKERHDKGLKTISRFLCRSNSFFFLISTQRSLVSQSAYVSYLNRDTSIFWTKFDKSDQSGMQAQIDIPVIISQITLPRNVRQFVEAVQGLNFTLCIQNIFFLIHYNIISGEQNFLITMSFQVTPAPLKLSMFVVDPEFNYLKMQ